MERTNKERRKASMSQKVQNKGERNADKGASLELPEPAPGIPDQASAVHSKGPSRGERVELIDLEQEIEQDEGLEAIKKTIREVETSGKSRKVLDKRFKFCPHCHNLLSVNYMDKGKDSFWRWKCRTCPFMKKITGIHRYVVHQFPESEEAEQIVKLEEANAHRQRTQVLCPTCSHTEAFFYQMQTRSADEPMTNFYQCCSITCRHNWQD